MKQTQQKPAAAKYIFILLLGIVIGGIITPFLLAPSFNNERQTWEIEKNQSINEAFAYGQGWGKAQTLKDVNEFIQSQYDSNLPIELKKENGTVTARFVPKR